MISISEPGIELDHQIELYSRGSELQNLICLEQAVGKIIPRLQTRLRRRQPLARVLTRRMRQVQGVPFKIVMLTMAVMVINQNVPGSSPAQVASASNSIRGRIQSSPAIIMAWGRCGD